MSTQTGADLNVSDAPRLDADGRATLLPLPSTATGALAAGRQKVRDVPLAATASICAGALLLAAPAIWNGFPFLFWDSGGYLEAGIHTAIVPGRSMLYGLLLSAGRWPSFWPVVGLQCLLAAWIIALLFRVHGQGGRHLAYLATCAFLAAFSALPFVAGELMPDIFAALAPLALYLLMFKGSDLKTPQAAILAATVAFGGGMHGSVLATLLVLFGLAMIPGCLSPRLRAGLRFRVVAMALGVALLVTPTVNFLLAGRFMPTPGGMAFVFGRLLEDGVIDRYLLKHCPDPAQPLCYYRDEMPSTADDFLWDNNDVFVALGGMETGIPHMRDAVIGALVTFPLENISLAARAFARQMVTTQTGDSLFNYLTDSTDAIAQLVPSAVPAMAHAQQQAWPGLDFTAVNKIHVPLAIAAIALLALAGAWSWAKRQSDGARLSLCVLAILLVNAAVCGILSNPVNRYQARVAWLAFPALAIVALSASAASRPRSPGRP